MLVLQNQSPGLFPPTDWPAPPELWKKLWAERNVHSLRFFLGVDSRIAHARPEEISRSGFLNLDERNGRLVLVLSSIRGAYLFYAHEVPVRYLRRIEYNTQKMRKLNPIIWVNPDPVTPEYTPRIPL